jgi:hypothetical protein
MTAWVWVVVGIWAVGVYAAVRLVRASTRTLPPPYEPRIDGWAAFGTCRGCNTQHWVHRGVIVPHDRPKPWTPCDGSGQPPAGGAG